MSDEYDYLFKCICVGDGGCGKTALIIRFSQGYFQEQYKMTIGVEFAVKTIELYNGKRVKLQIWDTAGQERFQYVRPLYYKGSMGAILLFDLTNRESFEHIPKWIDEVRTNAGDIPMLLVGNKTDLADQRQVSREEAEAFAREFDMYYIESSAKDGTNVGDVFKILACLMVGIDVPPEYLGKESETAAAGAAAVEYSEEELPPLEPLDESIFDEIESGPAESSVSTPGPSVPPAFAEDSMETKGPPKVPEIPTPGKIEPPIVEPPTSAVQPSTAPSAEKKIPKLEFEMPPEFPSEDETEEWEIPDLTAIKPQEIGGTQAPAGTRITEKIPDEVLAPPVPPKPTKSKLPPPTVETAPFDVKIPDQKELEEFAPPVPPKKSAGPTTVTTEPSGPIVFDTGTGGEEQTEVPPPVVFDNYGEQTKQESVSASQTPPLSEGFTPIPTKPTEENGAPASAMTFPNAKPAPPPKGFKPKIIINTETKPAATPSTPSAPVSRGFGGTSQTIPFKPAEEKKEASPAYDTFLSALGVKGSRKSKPLFTPFTSLTKKESTPLFVPKQPEPKVVGKKEKKEKEKKEKKKKEKKKKEKKKGKTQDIIICPTCGAMVSSRYKFCNKCGTKLQ